ncbi:DNA methyltransferase [Spirochaetia bacterium]|nr:DNA methyltransferase [Spirochaetia bacterium]
MADIKNIRDFKGLLSWLSRELNWNTGLDEEFEDIADITYDFDAKDIHLKPEEFAKITSLKQLRPLYEKQPWGIFAVEFETKRFEVSSLRKVLSGLIPRRRNRDHAVWDKKNLLFFCFWGEKNNRTFGAVYFEDKANALPAIKTFYCAPKNEDPMILQKFAEKLVKLSWPNLPQKPNAADYEEWRRQWTSPFTQVYRQTIRDSAILTVELAGIALGIRQKIFDILLVETENGAIHELYGKFRKALIHDMTEEQFADMYAQTMVYGLFSARCMSNMNNEDARLESGSRLFEPRQAIDAIPGTNPFLQNLLKESFSRKNKLSFDELDLGDITLLLQNTDTERILEDFNRQTGGGREDPVIYFYEGFLNAYEKEQKKRRGVYYTPQPVVKFMVQAVDDILKTEFGIKDGLASTETKTIKLPLKKNGKPAGEKTETVSAIQILDPATGTGTFLRQIILQVWENFKKANAGATKNAIKNKWNIYVKNHLLPRLNGFELMMAPYAVAHMKLALVLRDTGYAFDEDQEHPDRVKVFLTNSLEEADKEEGQVMMFEHDALTEESLEARKTKKNRGINVVIGNPPYSGESANKGGWILSLLDDYKKEPGGIEKLNEKNPKWINDDYVKFIRYAQLFVERAGSGVVAYINNHSFLDNPTFRGMRWNLLKSFDKIYIIDLHGNAKKKETAPDGSKDENVFDIQQGVSINIFVKKSQKKKDDLAEVFHADLYGLRDYKYNELFNKNLGNIIFSKIAYTDPNYFFVPKDFSEQGQYDTGFALTDLFQLNSVGVVTGRDDLAIQMTKKALKDVLNDFAYLKPEIARLKYKLGKDSRDWTVERAQQDLIKSGLNEHNIKKISYRPFDVRWTYYTGNSRGFHCMARARVMGHYLSSKNYGLMVCRQQKTNGFYHCLIHTEIVESSYVSNKTSEIGYSFPLYLYNDKKHRRPNLNPKIIAELEQKLNLSFVPEKGDTLTLTNGGFKDGSFSPGQLAENTFCPIDLLDYIYAVLHSHVYRETYKEFLKIDFPRIPYPTDQKAFWCLAALGGELRRLHLLEGPEFEKIDADASITGKISIEKVRYSDGKVFVNDDFCFENVPQTAWDFYIGGYQPAQKWLKDRKGCILKAEDLKHYRKIILALTETSQIMGEIDGVGVIK